MDLKELETIARTEMARYDLNGWTFGLAATKRRLGVCKYRTKRIEIAEFHAANNPPSIVLDTLLHEIAHALAGPAARHGPKWKAIAVRPGASPAACDDSPETAHSPGDWQATCSTCNRMFYRYRRPKMLSGYRCKCPTKSPLVFAWVGDPALKPEVPMTLEESARWEAHCAGCSTVHLRVKRPKAGRWRCKCRHGCELIWRSRSRARLDK